MLKIMFVCIGLLSFANSASAAAIPCSNYVPVSSSANVTMGKVDSVYIDSSLGFVTIKLSQGLVNGTTTTCFVIAKRPYTGETLDSARPKIFLKGLMTAFTMGFSVGMTADSGMALLEVSKP